MSAPPQEPSQQALHEIHRIIRAAETGPDPAARVLVTAQRRLVLAHAAELYRLRELLRIEADMRTHMPTIDNEVVRLITACREVAFDVIAHVAGRRPPELRKRLMVALGA